MRATEAYVNTLSRILSQAQSRILSRHFLLSLLTACLCLLPTARAQAAEAPPKLEIFEAVSQHGDWIAMTIPSNRPVPSIVIFGAGQPKDKVRLTLSFRGPECAPPIFGFQATGTLGKNEAVVPLRLRVDKGKPRDFKARLTHSPFGTTFIQPEFYDLSDMSVFSRSLLDAEQLTFSLQLPGKPLVVKYDLRELGDTVYESIRVCLKANGQPSPEEQKKP